MTYYKILPIIRQARNEALIISTFIFSTGIKFHPAFCMKPEGWTSADLLFYIFRGQERLNMETLLSHPGSYPLPMDWLLVMILPMLVNMKRNRQYDTMAEIQYIIRSGSKTRYFLKGCFASILEIIVYYLLIILSTLLTTKILGGRLSGYPTAGNIATMYGLSNIPDLSQSTAVALYTLEPLLALTTLNVLNQTLSIICEPIVSTLICFGILLVSIFITNAILWCNGAMLQRSILFLPDGIAMKPIILVCFTVIGICVLSGITYTRHKDILLSK